MGLRQVCTVTQVDHPWFTNKTHCRRCCCIDILADCLMPLQVCETTNDQWATTGHIRIDKLLYNYSQLKILSCLAHLTDDDGIYYM
jgi:hypothetical protein